MTATEEAQRLVTLFQTQHPGEKIAISASGEISLVSPTYRIKPLVWKDQGDDHHIASTILGLIIAAKTVDDNGEWWQADEDESHFTDSLESAKAAAALHWTQMLEQALERVE